MVSLFIFILTISASVAFSAPQEQLYPIDRIIDAQITAKNELKLYTSVQYPNGCFKPKLSTGKLESSYNSIELKHSVQLIDGNCTQSIINQNPVIKLPKPESGTYQIIDQFSNASLGLLKIKDNDLEISF